MNARLALLGTVAPGVAESEVFRLALQHAVGELGALGGMIHLRGPMSALRLVSAAGLPPALTRSWEIIDQEGPLAPARALHEGSGVWMPLRPPAARTNGAPASAPGPAAASRTTAAPASATVPGATVPPASTAVPFRPVVPAPAAGPAAGPAGVSYRPANQTPGVDWPGTGLAALPMSSGRRRIGALTVLTDERGEPTPEHWDFLRSVISWTEDRMVQAPPTAGPSRAGPNGDRVRQALKEVRVGSWDWNIRSGELLWDEAALELYGTLPHDYTGKVEDWMRCVHPDDLAPTLALVDRAIRDRSVFEAEYRVRRLDGTYGWTQARGRATYDDRGEALRMIGVGWESNESRSARDALSRALRHMSDGFLAVDDDWRITFANLEAERTLGFSEEELFGQLLWELPATRQVPGLEIRCRQAANADKSVGFDIRMPDSGRRYHLRLVPGPDGRTLYFTDVTEKRRMEEERRSAERAASERATRIAELTTALAKATTSKDVVDAVARRVLPPFAATGLVVQTVEGDRLHTVGSVGYPDDILAILDGRERTEPSPLWDAIVAGTPLFLSSVAEFVSRYPSMADLPRRAGKQAWALLPLTASGHTFGICGVTFDHPRRLNDEERTLLTATSALVAQALERARLFDAEHTRSRELQRSLLPRDLPDLPACTAAARYLPAGQGMDVGGDWYDIIPLSGGQVALVVGDVMGHGLPEAATMGRLRTAVHTLADLELPPDEIMSHLNDIVGGWGEESYVTCLYALYDSTTRVCTIARAGHPPPALLRPDGTVVFPELAADPPLGAAEPPFETTELTVPEGSLLVLYTDGLVESSKQEMDEGMKALADVLGTAHADGTTTDLEQLCERMTATLLPAEHQAADDAAFLVARPHALPSSRIASWPLPEDPRAASQARRLIRDQLAAWDLDALTPTTELLVSEMVGNVVRHARGPLRLRLLHGTDLICEVFDGSLTMPRIRRATDTDEGGRGLQLITALSQRWGTRYTPTGKCIWTEQAIQPPDTARHRPASPDALEGMFLDIEGLGADFDGDLDALTFGDQEL